MSYNQPLLTKQTALSSFALLLLIVGAYFSYYPGLTGGFIFDDFPNLSKLGQYKQYGYWDNFWLFLLEGQSGPTGRPVSLASFYFNASSWPSNPLEFIRTNIFIHLINGLLIYWLSFKLSSKLGLSHALQLIFSLLAAALWVLNPMHITSVLYIIQRMTELSATFILTGVLSYLYGREQLNKSNKGFITLFLGVGISLILSLLSKENGVLLVAYILVIEFFLLRPLNQQPPKYFNFWLVPTVVIPFISIIIYLWIHANPDHYSIRNFTLTERLLTEPRILFNYLWHILVPTTGYNTVFHDDYLISKSLLSPFTTLSSILGIVALLTGSFLLRTKVPVLAFAIAWFFAGHLIESTVIPLELYFEHRNYLPLFGITFLVAWFMSKLISSYEVISLALIGAILAFNILILVQSTKIWGDPVLRAINTYKLHPRSERSRLAYNSVANNLPHIKPVLIKKQKNATNSNQSMFYASSALSDLANACASNNLSTEKLNAIIPKLKENLVHVSSAPALLNFISQWKKKMCSNLSADQIKTFLIKISSLKSVQDSSIFAYNVHLTLGELYNTEKDLHNSVLHLKKAYEYDPTLKVLELRSFYLYNAGKYKKSLEVIKDTSKIEQRGLRAKLALKIKEKDLKVIKNHLKLKIIGEQKRKK